MYRYGQGYEWDKDNKLWIKNTTDYYYGNRYSAANDPFQTNVAMATEDNGEYTLSDIKSNNSRNTVYNSYELTDVSKAAARNLYGVVDWANPNVSGDSGETIRFTTTSTTRYYWVTFGKDGGVKTWVGYNNAPEGFSAERGYAVTSTVTSVDEQAANYEIAQVVVFEGATSEDEYRAMIPYAYAANKRYQGLGWDGEGYSDESKVQNSSANAGNLLNSVFDYDTGKQVTENFGKYGIWAGYVVTSRDTNPDYYQFSRSNTIVEPRGFFADESPAADYTSGDLDKAYRVIDKKTGSLGGYTTDTADLKLGEKVIYFVDDKDNVELVINVSESGNDTIAAELSKLWRDIVLDYSDYQSVTVKQMFAGAEIGSFQVGLDKGVAKFNFTASGTEFDLLGYNWSGNVNDVNCPADCVKEIVNNNTLRVTGLKGGDEITIEYTKDAGKLVDGDNGPIVLTNNGGNESDDPVYTNFELREKDKNPALKAVNNNDGKLEAGEEASLYFNKLKSRTMGTITINGKVVPADEITPVTGEHGAEKATYEKFKIDFTMPTDDEKAVEIVFGAGSKKEDKPVAPDVTVGSDGAATARPTVDSIKDAIAGADTSVVITVEQPEDKAEIKSTTVELNAEIVKAVVDAELPLTVQAPQGTVTLPASAITRAVSETENAKVEVVVAEADLENVENAPEGAVAVDVTVKVNGTDAELSELRDEITITLPYTGAEEKVDVYFVNAEDELEEVATGVAVKNGTVTFTVNHLTVFAVTQAVPAEDKALAEAKEYAKASLAGYVEWAKKNVSLESEWFNNEGELKDNSNTEGWENANYAAKENTTWCDELSNPALICELNLEAGIAEIEKMIDAAETVDDVKKIIWANRQDEAGNPIGGFDDLSWDSTDVESDFCKKFGYTGSLKAYIDQQVQLMLVEAAILEKNPNTDFSAAELDTLPTENVTDENRATHYLAAAIRGLYACVEVTPA